MPNEKNYDDLWAKYAEAIDRQKADEAKSDARVSRMIELLESIDGNLERLLAHHSVA